MEGDESAVAIPIHGRDGKIEHFLSIHHAGLSNSNVNDFADALLSLGTPLKFWLDIAHAYRKMGKIKQALDLFTEEGMQEGE